MEIVNNLWNPFKRTRMTLMEYGLYSGAFANWVDEEIDKWDKEQVEKEQKKFQKRMEEFCQGILNPVTGMSIPTLLRKPQEAMDRLQKLSDSPPLLEPLNDEEINNLTKTKEMAESHTYKSIPMFMSEGIGGIIPELCSADFPAEDYLIQYNGYDGEIIIKLFYANNSSVERRCKRSDIYFLSAIYEWRLHDWRERNEGGYTWDETTWGEVSFDSGNSTLSINGKTIQGSPYITGTDVTSWFYINQENSSYLGGGNLMEEDMPDAQYESAEGVFKKPSFHKLFQHRFNKSGKRPF